MRHLCLLASLLLFSACDDAQPERGGGGSGGSGGGGGGGGGGGSVNCSTATALESFATAYAEAAGRCDVGGSLARGPVSQAAFSNFLQANFAATLAPSLAAGTVRWNEASLCAAISSLGGDSCAIDDDDWDLLDGTRPLGGDCNWNDECATGWCQFGDTCPGVCTELLAIGATCTTSNSCPPGANCTFGIGVEGTCQEEDPRTYVPVGGACDAEGARCLRSYCDGTVCQPYPTPGQSCAATNRCDGGFCDTATDTCRLWLDTGAACSNTRDCRDGLFCDLNMNMPACMPRLSNGEPCTSTGPSDSCASGICNEESLCADAFAPRDCAAR